jgi:hypothetical protein
MDNTDLTPLSEEMYGPQFCVVVRPYLAVLDDLSPEQAQLVHQHVDNCSACAAELRLLNRATTVIADFAGRSETAPSARVDEAIMAALAARKKGPVKESVLAAAQRRPIRKRQNIAWRVGQLAVAAVFLLAALAVLYSHTAYAFSIPANVSWSHYVLYHSETRVGADGVQYRVESYHDMSSDSMHVETLIAGQLDVVAVSDGHETMGMDMMHHVVQVGANVWSVDDSLFNLAALRSDLQTNRAVYLGKDRFRGQDVYRIRTRDGLILLLNMQYMPINVLSSSMNGPMYDTLMWLLPSQVPDSMWDMSMPQGFKIGNLPPRP